MGCTQASEMPLSLVQMKRCDALNLSFSQISSLNSSYGVYAEDTQKVQIQPQKLALKIITRYANLIIFRTLYCSFKCWKWEKVGNLKYIESIPSFYLESREISCIILEEDNEVIENIEVDKDDDDDTNEMSTLHCEYKHSVDPLLLHSFTQFSKPMIQIDSAFTISSVHFLIFSKPQTSLLQHHFKEKTITYAFAKPHTSLLQNHSKKKTIICAFAKPSTSLLEKHLKEKTTTSAFAKPLNLCLVIQKNVFFSLNIEKKLTITPMIYTKANLLRSLTQSFTTNSSHQKSAKIYEKTLSVSSNTIKNTYKHHKSLSLLPNTLLLSLQAKEQTKLMGNLAFVIKTCENLAEKKHLLDKKELSDGIIPRNMGEFVVDYLNRQFGIQAVGQKMLNKFMNTLEKFKDHKYAKIYCRMIGVHCKSPLPLNLVVYLCKVRADFSKMIEKKNKMIAKFAYGQRKDMFEDLEVGGTAMLDTVLEYFHKNFKQKFTLDLLLQEICPPTAKQLDFLLFYASYRLSKLGQNTLSGNDKHEILCQLENLYDFTLSPDQHTHIKNFVYQEDLKTINSRLNLQVYQRDSLNCYNFVTKSHFLTVILNTYKKIKKDFLRILIAVYANFEDIDPDNFTAMVKYVEPNFSLEFISFLCSRAKEMDNGLKASQETFVHLMIYYAAGCLKEFRNVYIDYSLFNIGTNPRRVDYADMCIKPKDAFDLRSPITKVRQ